MAADEGKAFRRRIRRILRTHEAGPSLYPTWRWTIASPGDDKDEADAGAVLSVADPAAEHGGYWSVPAGASDTVISAGITLLVDQYLRVLAVEGIRREPPRA